MSSTPDDSTAAAGRPAAREPSAEERTERDAGGQEGAAMAQGGAERSAGGSEGPRAEPRSAQPATQRQGAAVAQTGPHPSQDDPSGWEGGPDEKVIVGEEALGLLGKRVSGRYQVLRKMGEGGMGIVYLAEHTAIGKRVALKVLFHEFARREETKRRFLQEARAAACIGHPNIVDITDFGETPDGSVFFAMEFLDGVDLSQVIRERGAIAWTDAKGILVQICRAMSAAHQKGIVHRDLKPENIFLIEVDGQPDVVKILDFGIAKVSPLDGGEGRLTRTGVIFGTPEYMSPEQAQGNALDHRADIYSLGVIIYEMLTGRVPFKADTFMGTLSKHVFEEPAPLRGTGVLVPARVESLVLRALAKDPEARFQTMEELAAAVVGVATRPPLGLGAMKSRSRTVPEPAWAGASGEDTGEASSPPGGRGASSAAEEGRGSSPFHLDTGPRPRWSGQRQGTRRTLPLVIAGITVLGLLAMGVWMARHGSPEGGAQSAAADMPVGAADARVGADRRQRPDLALHRSSSPSERNGAPRSADDQHRAAPTAHRDQPPSAKRAKRAPEGERRRPVRRRRRRRPALDPTLELVAPPPGATSMPSGIVPGEKELPEESSPAEEQPPGKGSSAQEQPPGESSPAQEQPPTGESAPTKPAAEVGESAVPTGEPSPPGEGNAEEEAKEKGQEKGQEKDEAVPPRAPPEAREPPSPAGP